MSSGGKVDSGYMSSGGKVDSEPKFPVNIPQTQQAIFHDILKLARFVCTVRYGDKADENYKKLSRISSRIA